jgi:hypothetical protein
MSIVKLNNRSVKDITAFGSITSLGSLTHIATQTASSSASISFTSGIDSTYKEYIFYFVNIHPQTDDKNFHFNMSIDGGSNYNVTKTTTFYEGYHKEDGSDSGLQYNTYVDLAQSTDFQPLAYNVGGDSDESCSGTLHLFNPSSTTFVKHYISRFNAYNSGNYSVDQFSAGYGNTTSAVNAIQFKFVSGNIDSGQILLFGLN